MSRMSCGDGDSGLAALSQPPFGEGRPPLLRASIFIWASPRSGRWVELSLSIGPWTRSLEVAVGLFQRLTPDTSWCAKVHARVTQENMNELSKNIPSSLVLILCFPSVDSCYYSMDSKKTKIPLFRWGSECRWGIYVCTQSH